LVTNELTPTSNLATFNRHRCYIRLAFALAVLIGLAPFVAALAPPSTTPSAWCIGSWAFSAVVAMVSWASIRTSLLLAEKQAKALDEVDRQHALEQQRTREALTRWPS
jgi:hypothetical protein